MSTRRERLATAQAREQRHQARRLGLLTAFPDLELINGARPCVLRMIETASRIYRGSEPVTTSSLAKAFEVSSKTIQRDIEFLRDQVGLPIRYDSSRHRWIVDGTWQIPLWLKEISELITTHARPEIETRR